MATVWNLLLLFAVVGFTNGQNYKVCSALENLNNCQALEKDDSRVSCSIVSDSIDCALRLASNEAQLGVFNEEELLLLAQQQPGLHSVIAVLRDTSKLNDPYAFESVAVVRSDHSNGLEGLRGGGLCHPGYDHHHELRWSPRVLKYFEQKVATSASGCDSSISPARSEAITLNNFFTAGACRPGAWSFDPTEDQSLKTEFQQLCSLCNSPANTTCTYGYTTELVSVAGLTTNPHINAVQCLVRGSGNVSYVAWQHVREFFGARDGIESYGLLCENGTVVTLSREYLAQTTAPCSWIRQPWSAIVASSDAASSLQSDLKSWLPDGSSVSAGSWQDTLSRIIVKEPSTAVVHLETSQSTVDYVQAARTLPNMESDVQSCSVVQQWCTISNHETQKCEWIRRAAYSLGIEPRISCTQAVSEIGCLNNIQMARADFVAIDSNYGYLARQHYRLSPVLYMQTRRSASSRVIALLKDRSTQGVNATITRFENLRDKVACFPEYGGIAWVSFVRTAHERSIVSKSVCDYPSAVATYFSSVCAPGADQADHTITTSVSAESLCSACRGSNDVNTQVCSANYSNQYFSTNGSLACIAASHTDVAFIEQQYLASYFTSLNLNVSEYRVLCSNNSLATNAGIDVDDNCLLSLTVDGEILTRRDYNQITSLKSLLRQLDELFGYTASRQLITLKMYNPFNRINNLLFKNSATGLDDSTSKNEQILNYIQLFEHLEACTGSGSTLYSMTSRLLPATTITLIVFLTKYIF